MGCSGHLGRYGICLHGEGPQFYTVFVAWGIADSVTHACLNFPYILMEHFISKGNLSRLNRPSLFCFYFALDIILLVCSLVYRVSLPHPPFSYCYKQEKG